LEGDEMVRRLKLFSWVIGIILGVLALVLLIAILIYPYEYVRRVLAWRETDYGDYMNNFPSRKLSAAARTFHFKESPDEERVEGLFKALLQVDDFETLLEAENTQAFIVIQDDRILYEKYFNGTQRDTLLTSFSVAKSFASALIGIAIAEGHIQSVDDPITDYLPELAARDPGFERVTIRHLLMMASGFEYQPMRWAILNGDDTLTSYYPDQRHAALEFPQIADPPGEYFLYNKYHPQLLGLILERATGKSVTQYIQEKIWDPLGMEFDGSMSLDSEASGFEKMEAGVNARAIDFAKFGRLYLRKGEWEGEQIIPNSWIEESIELDQESYNPAYYSDEYGQLIFDSLGGYYKYMWYGYLRDGGDFDFGAEGDHGQYIYVSPSKNLIIVRNSLAYGELGNEDWTRLFYQFASEF
jgi:CubicO group peptidase (beta-lactamase class C family)